MRARIEHAIREPGAGQVSGRVAAGEGGAAGDADRRAEQSDRAHSEGDVGCRGNRSAMLFRQRGARDGKIDDGGTGHAHRSTAAAPMIRQTPAVASPPRILPIRNAIPFTR